MVQYSFLSTYVVVVACIHVKSVVVSATVSDVPAYVYNHKLNRYQFINSIMV